MSFATVALVLGTRPEAIKLAPVHRALAARSALRPVLVSTGQHRELLDGALRPLRLEAEHDLRIMREDQSPSDIAARVLDRLPAVLERLSPQVLVVQGDTTTALAAALAAYHMAIPVAHVEAGLRTYDQAHPFPEEANRQLIDRLSRWCFAPTDLAAGNLRSEKVGGAVHVCGNTAVDSLLWMHARLTGTAVEPPGVLITLHRRESFGEPLRNLLGAVADFLSAQLDATALWPVHPNPRVTAVTDSLLGGCDRLRLVPPLDYAGFVETLASCRLVLTDSGGIQEEAPSLGKIVLVARETSERPEAIALGRSRLVGRDRNAVTAALLEAWNEPPYQGRIPAPNPYGDGRAGERIARVLGNDLSSAVGKRAPKPRNELWPKALDDRAPQPLECKEAGAHHDE